MRTIALWVPATTRVIADAPQFRALHRRVSRADIQTELEDLIVSGDGIGENFTGIMTVAGTQTLAGSRCGPATNLDSIRKAMTLIRVNARTEPTAVVLNPTDAQNIDLLKVNAKPTLCRPRPLRDWQPQSVGSACGGDRCTRRRYGSGR